ncbi:MAG TPA: hypothetical protein VFU19_16290 [Iamia sp.]|nr:hypothetical protein [Iamia sp.]
MSDDTRPDGDDPADVEQLREEVASLRRQIEGEVRTRSVLIVDEDGADRVRLSADGDACRVVLVDTDGFERVSLEADGTQGALRIAGRANGPGPNRVDVFAIDPEDDAGIYVGVELVDAGTSVAGFTAMEGRRPRTWTLRDVHD